MKTSNEWLREGDLIQQLDEWAKADGVDIATAKAYPAAKALGLEPNGKFYACFKSWRKERLAENAAPFLDPSPAVRESVGKVIATSAQDLLSEVLHQIGLANGSVNQAAELRIAAAERRADEAEAEVDQLVQNWTEAEAQRDDLKGQVEALTAQLSDLQGQYARLEGRLEEREHLSSAPAAHGAVPPLADGTALVDDNDAEADPVEPVNVVNCDPSSAADQVAPEDDASSEPRDLFDYHPSDIEKHRPKGGADEMSSGSITPTAGGRHDADEG